MENRLDEQKSNNKCELCFRYEKIENSNKCESCSAIMKHSLKPYIEEHGRLQNTNIDHSIFVNQPIIIKEHYEVTIATTVELIQTEEDKKFSLENNVRRFSSIRYKDEIITDKEEIRKIMGNP